MKFSLHSLIHFLPLFSAQFNSSVPGCPASRNSTLHFRLLFSTTSPESESKSESKLLYDWRFTKSVHLGDKPLETYDHYFFQQNICGCSPYVTSSLTRGWACRLQLLLVLASAVILKSESCGAHDHILLSHIRDFSNLEDQVPVFISPRNRVAQLHPQALGSLFVASYDSQGYDWGIRYRHHTVFFLQPPSLSLYNPTARTSR
jgi:hypothetical protein